MQQEEIKTLLENNNFRNNQNYVIGNYLKEKIKLKTKIGILHPKNVNGKISNILGFDKYEYINIFLLDNVLKINSKNYYTGIFLGYSLLMIIFLIIWYFIPIIVILFLIYFIFIFFKGKKTENEIKQLKFFIDNKSIIYVNNNISKFVNEKIVNLDKKNIKVDKYIINKNLLNNQNYVFGTKMKNIVKIGMFTSNGMFSSVGNGRNKKSMKNIIGFKKDKNFQYIFYKLIKDNVGDVNGGFKSIAIIGFILSIPFRIILFIMLFGNYGLLIELLLFLLLIYFLFFHKYKFSGFGKFKVIYDKDLIYFIKKTNATRRNKSITGK